MLSTPQCAHALPLLSDLSLFYQTAHILWTSWTQPHCLTVTCWILHIFSYKFWTDCLPKKELLIKNLKPTLRTFSCGYSSHKTSRVSASHLWATLIKLSRWHLKGEPILNTALHLRCILTCLGQLKGDQPQKKKAWKTRFLWTLQRLAKLWGNFNGDSVGVCVDIWGFATSEDTHYKMYFSFRKSLRALCHKVIHRVLENVNTVWTGGSK